jgi:hypothetical protein
MLPVYVPADVGFAQSGESLSVHVLAAVPVFVFVSFAAQFPECPLAMRVREILAPEPDVFHPERSASKPEFSTRLVAATTTTCLLAVDERPPVSVTVTLTVYVPAAVYVCVALAPACGPTTGEPSPKSNR